MTNVCQTCGDVGFREARVYCDSCKIEVVHRYCLGITPVPFVEYITWFCEGCDCSDGGSDSNEVDHIAKLKDISKNKKKKKNNVSNKHIPPGLNDGFQVTSDVESVELSSSPVIETMMESERRNRSYTEKSDELSGLLRNQASVPEARSGSSVSEKTEKGKKNKKQKTNKENKKKKKNKNIINHTPWQS